MFAVSLSIDMYETKIVNRKKSLKVSEELLKYIMTLKPNTSDPSSG